MNDHGRLLDHIIQHTDRRFNEMHERLEKLDEKIQILLSFKWQLIGGAVSLSILTGILVQLIAAFVSKS